MRVLLPEGWAAELVLGLVQMWAAKVYEGSTISVVVLRGMEKE
jgi:hypothetical protein